MKVRFKMSWRQYREGQVLENLADGMANEMIRRNICEPISDQVLRAPADYEVATLAGSPERAVKSFVSRRR